MGTSKWEIAEMIKKKPKSKKSKNPEIANFFFEVNTLRKVARIHRQTLLADDLSDNIASHSFLVAHIGYYLALKEKADAGKVAIMCLFHDLAEARSNDHNWVHKKYVKVFEDEIRKDQKESAPHGALFGPIVEEYEARKTPEARIAKDADLIAQIVLLKEYSHIGNQEAGEWIGPKSVYKFTRERYFSEAAYELALALRDSKPSDWWSNLWTSKNR